MFENECDLEGNDAGHREVLNAENRAKPQAWASDAWLKDVWLVVGTACWEEDWGAFRRAEQWVSILQTNQIIK